MINLVPFGPPFCEVAVKGCLDFVLSQIAILRLYILKYKLRPKCSNRIAAAMISNCLNYFKINIIELNFKINNNKVIFLNYLRVVHLSNLSGVCGAFKELWQKFALIVKSNNN